MLTDHITHKSGMRKTVCVSHCLAAFGISPDQYHYTGHIEDTRREAILRRFGYAVRSRKSAIGKAKTVGQAREKIQNLKDPIGTRYLVIVVGGNWAHAIVLNQNGDTIVDTDPRKKDKRRILSIKAVYLN